MSASRLAGVVCGLVVIALGVVLLLDGVEAVDLDLGGVAPLLLAAWGTILLATGLGRRQDQR